MATHVVNDSPPISSGLAFVRKVSSRGLSARGFISGGRGALLGVQNGQGQKGKNNSVQ